MILSVQHETISSREPFNIPVTLFVGSEAAEVLNSPPSGVGWIMRKNHELGVILCTREWSGVFKEAAIRTVKRCVSSWSKGCTGDSGRAD
jgi:hypothetical protein